MSGYGSTSDARKRLADLAETKPNPSPASLAAREVAQGCRERIAWNYDTIECKVLEAVALAFETFADILEGNQ